MAEGRFVAYYRVSTDRQGESGLGLEAQQRAVQNYLDGGNWELVAEFTEVESGKSIRRPQLDTALAACKRHGATLVIAKLDRLARNVYFVAGLMESGVPFVAVDNPHATKMVIQIMAVFAEHERDMISQRTKEGLASAKARGVELGKHGKILAKKNRAAADDHARQIAPAVRRLQADAKSYRALVEAMNAEAVPTMKGGVWHLPTVHSTLKRLDRLGL
jgi:DNA invertase Pin-like site-specific DNA recombinase